jgi:hypothetical protein
MIILLAKKVKTLIKEDYKMVMRSVLIAVMAGLLVGCAGMQPYSAPTAVDRGQSPIILDAYAAPTISWGSNWMIYVRAEDPNGDMKSIAAVLWQAGVGYYPTEVTRLKEGERKEFSGYLYLDIPPDSCFYSDEFELTLIVRDSHMNGSQPVKLPLRIDANAKQQEVPEKWQNEANRRIATLMFDVECSSHYNRSGNGGNFN